MLSSLPHFANEQEERAFWEANDSTDIVNWAEATQASFPNLVKSRVPEPTPQRPQSQERPTQDVPTPKRARSQVQRV